MLKLNQVHHIAIICSDYEKSKHFYSEILGLKIVREVYREARQSYKLDLEVGNRYQIELFHFPIPHHVRRTPKLPGLRHLAFEVNNLDEAVFHLNEQGVQVEPIRVDDCTGKRFTFFTDPDGLPLELYEV